MDILQLDLDKPLLYKALCDTVHGKLLSKSNTWYELLLKAGATENEPLGLGSHAVTLNMSILTYIFPDQNPAAVAEKEEHKKADEEEKAKVAKKKLKEIEQLNLQKKSHEDEVKRLLAREKDRADGEAKRLAELALVEAKRLKAMEEDKVAKDAEMVKLREVEQMIILKDSQKEPTKPATRLTLTPTTSSLSTKSKPTRNDLADAINRSMSLSTQTKEVIDLSGDIEIDKGEIDTFIHTLSASYRGSPASLTGMQKILRHFLQLPIHEQALVAETNMQSFFAAGVGGGTSSDGGISSGGFKRARSPASPEKPKKL